MRFWLGLVVATAAAWGSPGLAWASAGPASGLGAYALPRRPSPGQLRQDLLRMASVDQAMRAAMFAEGHSATEAERQAMAGKDAEHTEAMRAILAQVGWPGRSLVGPDGAKAAFLLVQHSPDLAFMAKALPLLEAAARRGEASLQDWALMHDRVALNRGGRQRFGTQFGIEGGRLVLDPCEDPAGLEARRASVGLPSMAEQDRAMTELYGMPVSRPEASPQPKWCPWPWRPAGAP